MLQGKSVLFIAPIFHDYHTIIIEKLESMGAKVLFCPERDYSWKFKVVNNFFHRYLHKKQENHYNRILKKIKNRKFDYLFVIRGYMINSRFIHQFRLMNPSARTVMYQWDSNKTNPFHSVIDDFDIVQSFDYEDCMKFKKVTYLPLFYTDDVAEEAVKFHEKKYDFFFMGTYMPERYAALIRFRDYLGENADRLKSFIYITKTSLKKEKMRGAKLDMDIVSTRHMPREEYLKLLNQSKVIVDVSNPRQTGLAMRIIEALASRKKILTVNKFIQNEPFYDSRNIAVFDADKPEFDENFVNSDFMGDIKVLPISEWLKKAMQL